MPAEAPDDHVRKVNKAPDASFKGRNVSIGMALRGKYVAFRPTRQDAFYRIHFRRYRIGAIDFNNPLQGTCWSDKGH